MWTAIPKKMKIEAFAKVNLTLEVFAKRADGYHALRSLVLPVSLSDTLEIEEALDITSDTGYSDDLIVKAAKTLRASVPDDGRVRGANIRVTKRIPAGGGLGGGSADAAATLVALNDLWALGLSREELADIGAQVGSDVPALVLGGPVVMEGRGEKVTRLDAVPALNLVLANPGVFSSTKEVYAACRPRLPDEGGILYNIKTSLRSGDPEAIGAALMNDLQAPAVALHPEIGAALEALRAAGATGVLMSGSGSTVFGLVPNEERGREIAALLNAKGLRAWSVQSRCPVV